MQRQATAAVCCARQARSVPQQVAIDCTWKEQFAKTSQNEKSMTTSDITLKVSGQKQAQGQQRCPHTAEAGLRLTRYSTPEWARNSAVELDSMPQADYKALAGRACTLL